jgi:hypothetical protein
VTGQGATPGQRKKAESPTAKQAAEKKERDFSQRPPKRVVAGCMTGSMAGLDVHSRMRGSVYDKAGPKSFDLPGRNQLIYRVERTMSRLRPGVCGVRQWATLNFTDARLPPDGLLAFGGPPRIASPAASALIVASLKF